LALIEDWSKGIQIKGSLKADRKAVIIYMKNVAECPQSRGKVLERSDKTQIYGSFQLNKNVLLSFFHFDRMGNKILQSDNSPTFYQQARFSGLFSAT
jgi:hypothetical protein